MITETDQRPPQNDEFRRAVPPRRPAARPPNNFSNDGLWFWQLLTVLVFAGTFALMFARPVQAADALADRSNMGWAGSWRVALALPGGELPFGVEIRQQGGRTSAWLLNPPERMRAEQVKLAGDTLTIAFPSYDARLELRRVGADRLQGQAFLLRSTGPVTLAATGVRGTWRFSPRPARPAANMTGRWTLSYGDKGLPGLAQLKQTGNLVSGSVQLASGDTRFLAGEIAGNRLSLSTFDGNAATLWTATLDRGALIDGHQFTATGSKQGTPWTARRAGGDKMEAVAVEKPATDRLAFRFPTSNGRMVSLGDPAYRGKVVVITLGGAWCPNCHDEAVFLGPYAAQHKAEGLEVIGLHFEYGDDQARSFRLIDNYKARYRLPYPLLLAGQPTPESTASALGALGPVKVYPSTIFVGRDGRVREVHVGWAGPATGPLNAEAKRDFDAIVTRLLKEPA
jgi:peroxiredoxin